MYTSCRKSSSSLSEMRRVVKIVATKRDRGKTKANIYVLGPGTALVTTHEPRLLFRPPENTTGDKEGKQVVVSEEGGMNMLELKKQQVFEAIGLLLIIIL